MAYKLEKTSSGYDIVINGFEKGIALSPYDGIADMRNVDPTTVPMEASVAMATEAMITQASITSATFTVNDTTDVFTYNGTIPLAVNTAITVSNSGGALPTGMIANQAYYVKTVPTSTTFTLSASIGGATLNVSSAGSGTNSFSTINMGTPKFIRNTSIVENEITSGNEIYILYFLLDSNGRCWVLDNLAYGNTGKWIYLNNLSSEASLQGGNGLIAWKNWLFVWQSASLRIISLINGGFSTLSYLSTENNWTTWKSSSDIFNLGASDVSHYALIGQDDAVYFCNGYGVGSILEVEGETFAPNSAVSVTGSVSTTSSDETLSYNGTASSSPFSNLDIGSSITGTNIPDGTFIASINSPTSVELSQDASGSSSSGTFTIPQSNTFNNTALAIPKTDEAVSLAELGINLLVGGRNNFIYPWDRVSPSYNFPIFLSENYVSRMVTVNTTCYIFVGRRGRIYVTNGSNANFYYKVPDFLSNTVNPTFIWTDAMYTRNLIFFGVRCRDNAGNTINQFGGLWALTPENASGWLINQLSYATYSGYANAVWPNLGSANSVTLSTGIFGANTGYGMFAGWNDGTNGGVDKQISTPYTAGQSYIDSDMIPVGTFLNKQTYQNVEFKLTTPLVSGESVALYWRSNITDSFTPLTLTSGGATGDLSGYANVNFQQIQWIQIRAVLTSTASSPSYVRLRELRIR